MNRITILTLLLIPLTFAQCQPTQKEETKQLPANELIGPSDFDELRKYENAVVLDVRTQGEVDRGYIDGSVHIDFQDAKFKQSLEALDKDKIYLVYCASGGRSRSTQKVMNDLGFKSVYDLKGGIVAWQKEGKEIIK